MINDHLEKKLEFQPEAETLTLRLNDIKRKVEPLLSKIVETFPDYTSHDISHSERILKQLNIIIPDCLIEKLNIYEIYFLIASSYLHDIGMINFPEFWNENKYNPNITEKQEVRDSIRENHHLRSEVVCVKKFLELGMEDEHQAKIIGRICRGHRKENLNNTELFKPDKIYKNYSINIPLLAALLRLGDELDLTSERTPAIVYENVPPRDEISNDEWEKHLSISGVALHPDDSLKIKCSATCKNPKIHRALKGLETKINYQLNFLPNHLYQYRECRKDIPRIFFMDIEPEGYTPCDLKFSLLEKEIVNLLMGEKLYKYKEESIRELLKNSLDACRFRNYIFKKNGVPYTPKIEFKITPDKNKLILIDNGIGMDEDIIERYFTKIGQSFYNSYDFLKNEIDFTPVNELGIGILSCFMIANRIIIETKMDDSEPITIEIDDVSDYFFIRDGKRINTGTTITLFLKEEAKEIDLEKQIRLYARHLDIPIELILPSSDELIIKDIGYNPDEILKDFDNKYGFYLFEIDEQNIEGVIGILYRKNDKKPLISPYMPRELEFLNNKNMKFCSNEGIFVENLDALPEWVKSNKIFVDLNIRRNVLDINVARNEIIRNEKNLIFKNIINKLLMNKITDFFKSFETDSKSDFYKKSRNIFYSYFNDSDLETYLSSKSEDSEILLKLLEEYSSFKYVSTNGYRYLTYNGIKNRGKNLIGLRMGEFNLKENHMKKILLNCSGFKEDNIYLLSNHFMYRFVKFLFGYVPTNNFLHQFQIIESDDLDGILPKSWKLVQFYNYHTSSFLEFSEWNATFVNRDNIFVELLIKNKHIIKGDKKMAILGIFRSLKTDLNSDFSKVLTKQKEILKWFLDEGIINDENIDDYLFEPDDFPSYSI